MVVQSTMKGNTKKRPSSDNSRNIKRVIIETTNASSNSSNDSEDEQSSAEDDNGLRNNPEADSFNMEVENLNNDDGNFNSEDADDNSVDADNGSEGTDNDSKAADSDNETETGGSMMKNEGWADSVAKILGTKKPKNKKSLVLSRAKKFSEVVKKEEPPSFDVVGEEKKPKITEIKTENGVIKKKKLEHPSVRVKPNILEKDRERVLAKIATKGVVQLFNAVKNQQNSLGKQTDEAGLTEGKREKILKKFDKRTFLDTLMGQTKSTIVEDSHAHLKDEVKDEDKPKWVALRDDFMMGAKMKDWDKSTPDD